MRKRHLALICINALFVIVLLLTIGTTAAEMSDIENSPTQSASGGVLDVTASADAALDLTLSVTNLLPDAAQLQTFQLTNSASSTRAADLYAWIDPGTAASFPFCPAAGTKPVLVTIKDDTGTDQNMNLCDLVFDADGSSGIVKGSRAPFKIGNDIAAGATLSRNVSLIVSLDAQAIDWKNKTGTAALTIYGRQFDAPTPTLP